MSIRHRYYFSLVAILAMFAANVGVYVLSAQKRAMAAREWRRADAVERKISPISQSIAELYRLASWADQLVDGVAFVKGEERSFEEKTDKVKSQIEDLLATASPDQRGEIQSFYDNYLEMRQGWISFYHHGPRDTTGVLSFIEAENVWKRVSAEQIPQLHFEVESQAADAWQAAQQAERRANWAMLGTFSLSIIVAVGFSYSFSRRLSFGLTTLTRGAQQIGAMRLDHRIAYHLNDELSEVANAFNAMSEKLSASQMELLETNRQLSESETRYRTLVNRAVYGIYSCTEDGRFLDANPALIQMLGYANKQALFDLDMISEVFKNSQEYKALLERFKASGSVEGVEVSWRKKTGETIIARLSGNMVTNHQSIAEYEMIAENVTQHRALEEQFRQAQKMEAIGRLAGGIAHDFNNLLTVIKGHCELIGGNLGPGASIASEIEGVSRAAERAQVLTRQLLAFSRRQLLAPKNVDLNSIVANMEQLLNRLLGENVRLRAALDPDAGAILADPNQIEQVIMNLAVNARDAMSDGGEVWISTSRLNVKEEFRQGDMSLPPGRYAVLSVRDTGQGMDALTCSRAFEPFFTTKDPGKGTGLGLSTVYGIVKQSNAEIRLDSAPGQGAAFHIYFPQVGTEHKAVEPAPRRATKNEGRETILIVEDEDDVRNVAMLMLKRRGYRVLSTGQAEEARSICRAFPEPIHLLLTDVVLQEAGGLDLAHELVQTRPEMKVIYMSGYTEDVVLQHGIRNSQVAFVPKPFTTEELSSKVREVLDQPGLAPLFMHQAFKS